MRKKAGGVSPEEIEKARSVDLLSYLRACDPGELVHVSGSTYCTRSHDSLKISNGAWMWFSQGIGGWSALDYLIKVRNYGFIEAVRAINGQEVRGDAPVFCREKTPRLTRGSVNAMRLTRNPPTVRIELRSANCNQTKEEYIKHQLDEDKSGEQLSIPEVEKYSKKKK